MFRWGRWFHCHDADGPGPMAAMRVPGGVLVNTFDWANETECDCMPPLSTTSLAFVPCDSDAAVRFMASLGCADDSEPAGEA